MKTLIVLLLVLMVSTSVSAAEIPPESLPSNANFDCMEYTESLIRNEELQKTLDSYGTDEFVEEQAREKLGYAYPEEHFYIDVSGTD